jgi:hypothetical protein
MYFEKIPWNGIPCKKFIGNKIPWKKNPWK